MIKFTGSADSARLFRLVDDHATEIAGLIAPMAVVLLDVLGRGEDLHKITVTQGWNRVNIWLANGERIALRARKREGVYRMVRVHRGGFRPLGEVEFEMTDPDHVVRRFRQALHRWVRA